MELFTIDVLKISGECYCILENDKITTFPTMVDINTTVVTPISKDIEFKIADSLEELNEELVSLGYTLENENNNIE